MSIKVCLFCNKNFNTTGHNQKFCSTSCRDKYRYRNNKEERLQYCAEWREKNKDKLDDYYILNKEKRRSSAKNWQDNHKDMVSLKNKEWNENNREKRNAINRKYYQTIKDNEKTKINRNMRKGIYKSLRGNKNNSWTKLVEYSIEELKIHLQSTLYDGFLWKDYLNGNLHIDHIIPISLYNITDSNCIEFKNCWSLKNLRLLESSENHSKQDKLDWDLIGKHGLMDILPKVLCGREEKDLYEG